MHVRILSSSTHVYISFGMLSDSRSPRTANKESRKQGKQEARQASSVDVPVHAGCCWVMQWMFPPPRRISRLCTPTTFLSWKIACARRLSTFLVSCLEKAHVSPGASRSLRCPTAPRRIGARRRRRCTGKN
eukprot:scaffold3272_cov239-Pinguiococcus_pyrenoidosus.AAC.1